MTRDEFVRIIETGDDIMFDVHGKHYTILTWPEDGIDINEQGKMTGRQVFKTPGLLLENFKVDGVSLGELVKDVVVTCYTSLV